LQSGVSDLKMLINVLGNQGRFYLPQSASYLSPKNKKTPSGLLSTRGIEDQGASTNKKF
jgi:hypothetical protein